MGIYIYIYIHTYFSNHTYFNLGNDSSNYDVYLGGACGFREYGRTINNGYVSGVSRLYKYGSGCGACYQV